MVSSWPVWRRRRRPGSPPSPGRSASTSKRSSLSNRWFPAIPPASSGRTSPTRSGVVSVALRHHPLSALVVQRENAPASSFSFGMPLTDQGVVDQEHGRWQELSLPLWESGFLISGVLASFLVFGGQPWGTIRYWLLPRPGFEVHDARRLTEVDVGLLKGGTGRRRHRGDRPAGALRPLHRDGRASLSLLGRGSAAAARAPSLQGVPSAGRGGRHRRGRPAPGPARRARAGR